MHTHVHNITYREANNMWRVQEKYVIKLNYNQIKSQQNN